MKYVFLFVVFIGVLLNCGCDDWVDATPNTCDFYEFCFENTRDKKIAVYLNDDRVATIESGELICFDVEVGKQNVRVEKTQIIVLNRVLLDEWVDVEGSTCTRNWVID